MEVSETFKFVTSAKNDRGSISLSLSLSLSHTHTHTHTHTERQEVRVGPTNPHVANTPPVISVPMQLRETWAPPFSVWHCWEALIPPLRLEEFDP